MSPVEIQGTFYCENYGILYDRQRSLIMERILWLVALFLLLVSAILYVEYIDDQITELQHDKEMLEAKLEYCYNGNSSR
jgi:hypothetical protein